MLFKRGFFNSIVDMTLELSENPEPFYIRIAFYSTSKADLPRAKKYLAEAAHTKPNIEANPIHLKTLTRLIRLCNWLPVQDTNKSPHKVVGWQLPV